MGQNDQGAADHCESFERAAVRGKPFMKSMTQCTVRSGAR